MGAMQLVLGVTVVFMVGVNEPLDFYHTNSNGCDSEVYSWCE